MARNFGGSALVLATPAAALPMVTVLGVALALLPVLLLAAVALGRHSASPAAPLAALTIRCYPLGAAGGSAGPPAIALLSGAALEEVALLNEPDRGRT